MTLRDNFHASVSAQLPSAPRPVISAQTAIAGCIANLHLNDGAAAQAHLTLRDVISATKLSRTAIYEMRKTGLFPEPAERRGGKMYWSIDVISAWIIANRPSNLGRARRFKSTTGLNAPHGELRLPWKDWVWNEFIPKGATHFITMNLGNPGSASDFNRKWAPKSRQIARRFINILGRSLFGKTGWANPSNKARLHFFVRMETVPRSKADGAETHLHLHAMIDLSGPFPGGCFSALANDFKIKLRDSFAADAYCFRIDTEIEYILTDDDRRDIADYLSKDVWDDGDRIYNGENL